MSDRDYDGWIKHLRELWGPVGALAEGQVVWRDPTPRSQAETEKALDQLAEANLRPATSYAAHLAREMAAGREILPGSRQGQRVSFAIQDETNRIQHHTASRRNDMATGRARGITFPIDPGHHPLTLADSVELMGPGKPTFREAGIELGDKLRVVLADRTKLEGVLAGYTDDWGDGTKIDIGGSVTGMNIGGARFWLLGKRRLAGERYFQGIQPGDKIKVKIRIGEDSADVATVTGIFRSKTRQGETLIINIASAPTILAKHVIEVTKK